MNKSQYSGHLAEKRSFEVSTTALARVSVNKPVERLSYEQIANLKASVELHSKNSNADLHRAHVTEPCMANQTRDK